MKYLVSLTLFLVAIANAFSWYYTANMELSSDIVHLFAILAASVLAIVVLRRGFLTGSNLFLSLLIGGAVFAAVYGFGLVTGNLYPILPIVTLSGVIGYSVMAIVISLDEPYDDDDADVDGLGSIADYVTEDAGKPTTIAYTYPANDLSDVLAAADADSQVEVEKLSEYEYTLVDNEPVATVEEPAKEEPVTTEEPVKTTKSKARSKIKSKPSNGKWPGHVAGLEWHDVFRMWELYYTRNVTIAELAARYGVSERTAKRAIDFYDAH